MIGRSVRKNVDLILQNQGVQASQYDDIDILVDACARRLLAVVQKEVFEIRTNPTRFSSNRPMGWEVLDWLRDNHLSSYAPICSHHDLDSLFQVLI